MRMREICGRNSFAVNKLVLIRKPRPRLSLKNSLVERPSF